MELIVNHCKDVLVSIAISSPILSAFRVPGIFLETLPVVQGGGVIRVFPFRLEGAVEEVSQVAVVGPLVQDGVPQVGSRVALDAASSVGSVFSELKVEGV